MSDSEYIFIIENIPKITSTWFEFISPQAKNWKIAKICSSGNVYGYDVQSIELIDKKLFAIIENRRTSNLLIFISLNQSHAKIFIWFIPSETH